MTTTARPITEIAAETKRLAEAATAFRVVTSTVGGLWHVEVYDEDDNTKTHDNAEFIAASRTNAPLLADAVIEMVETLKHISTCHYRTDDTAEARISNQARLRDAVNTAYAALDKLGVTTTEEK